MPDISQLLNKDRKDFTRAAHSLQCLQIVSREPGDDDDGDCSVDTPSVKAACPNRSCVERMEMLEALQEKMDVLQARRKNLQLKMASHGPVLGGLIEIGYRYRECAWRRSS